jgi:hypothetical protein
MMPWAKGSWWISGPTIPTCENFLDLQLISPQDENIYVRMRPYRMPHRMLDGVPTSNPPRKVHIGK